MIIECNVSIKEILKKGKKFLWKKPKSCPCCGASALWGHGFVLCYFSHVTYGVYLKRYRCPTCKSVIKLKIAGFFKGFRTCTKTIHTSIIKRIKDKLIMKGVSRGCLNYWLRNLKKNIRAILGEKWKNLLVEGFEKLLSMSIVPVSCSISKE